MIKVALVRGKYLNNFEGQNYVLRSKQISLTGISSLFPLHDRFSFPVIRLPSIADLERLAILRRLVKIAGNRIMGDSQILFGLEKLADKFDIFHTADPHYYYSYQLARLRARNLIRKLIVTSWETMPFNNESVVRKKFIKRFTLKQADYFVCYTDRAKQVLIKEGVSEDKIEVVRLGVDLEKFKVQRSKMKDKKELVILFVGRLVKEKGVDDLRSAFNNIKNSRLRLNIVSSQPYEQMPGIYQNADIFVLPSKTTKTWEEQYGMVLIEAMASGLPVIAYDSGAISEVLGETGILVKEGNIDELTISISRLIKSSNLRFKLGKMGRRRAEKEFDSRKTAKKLINIYENIGRSLNQK